MGIEGESDRPERLSTIGGWLGFYIFALGFELFLYCIYLVALVLDRKTFTSIGQTIRFTEYQGVVAIVHVAVIFWLMRLLIQRRRIAIKYVKIAILVSAIFHIVVNPLLIGLVEPNFHMASLGRLWEGVVLGLVLPYAWYQYFQKSERVRLVLVK